jgi:hypothetical protein
MLQRFAIGISQPCATTTSEVGRAAQPRTRLISSSPIHLQHHSHLPSSHLFSSPAYQQKHPKATRWTFNTARGARHAVHLDLHPWTSRSGRSLQITEASVEHFSRTLTLLEQIPAMTVSLLIQKAPCGSFESTPLRLVLIHLQAPGAPRPIDRPRTCRTVHQPAPLQVQPFSQMHEAGARTRTTMAERFLPSETSSPITSPASQTTPGQALHPDRHCQPPP